MLIQQPNLLRLKVGGSSVLDPVVLAQADAAMHELSARFAGWIGDEITKLELARSQIANDPSAFGGIARTAHDLKGLGTTCGYPLVTRIAASLSRLAAAGLSSADTGLVNAHIDSLRALVTQDIRTADHVTGRALAEELESRAEVRLAA